MSKLHDVIIMYPKFNNSKNVLFLVDYSHYQNIKNPEHYRYDSSVILITKGVRVKSEKVHHRKPYIFIGENGKSYYVFSDWSAREIEGE